MGDTIKRIAVIINGDDEPRHLENVERSLGVLEGDGYETFVVSRQEPSSEHDHYVPATVDGVRRLFADVRAAADGDTEIVVYVSGHGDMTDGEPLVVFEDAAMGEGFADLVDGVPFKSRAVIMDECYSGNWARRFVDDPRTLFVSAGSTDQQTCCTEFAPHFWADDVPDRNGDGVISWQERYENVIARGDSPSVPKLSPSPGYVQPGVDPFPKGVVRVGDAAALNRLLERLSAGQYAIVMLNMEGCPACDNYRPNFQRMAEGANGQHLFIELESSDVAHELYGINAFPTVLLVDHEGRWRKVANRKKALEELASFEIPARQRVLSALKSMMGDDKELIQKAVVLEAMMKGTSFSALEEGISLSETQLVMTHMSAVMENGDIESEIERLGKYLKAHRWDEAGAEIRKSRDENLGYSTNLKCWVVISEALFSDHGDEIPSSLILDVAKMAATNPPTRAAFEILISRGEWGKVGNLLGLAKKIYTPKCRNMLCDAVVEHGRFEEIPPEAVLLQCIKTASTIETTEQLFRMLIKARAWESAIDALRYSQKHYNPTCNGELADAVVFDESASREAPAELFVQAFMSARTSYAAMKAVGLVIEREGLGPNLEVIKEQSKTRFTEGLQEELKAFIELKSKGMKPAGTKAGNAPDGTATVPLTFPSELIYR